MDDYVGKRPGGREDWIWCDKRNEEKVEEKREEVVDVKVVESRHCILRLDRVELGF